MEESQLKEILSTLSRRMRETQDNELYGQMADVRRDLRAWNRESELPHKELLLTWNVIASESVPTTPEPQPAAVLTEANVQQILKTLRNRIVDAGDRDDAAEELNLEAVWQAVLAWHKSGMSDDLPHAEQLSAWGIWPLAPEEALPLHVQTPLAEVPAQPAQPQQVVSSAPDPDDKLQEDYDLALGLMGQDQFLKARDELLKLQSRSSGRLKEAIEENLSRASQQLEEQTNRLIQEAKELSGESLDKQENAWRAVLKINLESDEAKRALKALEQQRVEKNIESDLAEASTRAATAKEKLDLPDLNRLLGNIEIWVSRGEKGELPQHLYIKAKTLKDEVIETRQEVRDKLGVVSTKRMQGDFRGAYQLARESSEYGIPALHDASGVMGQPGVEVPTPRFFEFIAGEFLSSIQTKVGERVDQARQEKTTDPEAAQASLLEARGWVTDEVLTLDHRRLLGTQLALVDQEFQNVARSLERYQQARQKVIEARTQADSAQVRLKLLREAQELFPGYLNLDQHLEQAQDDLAAEVAGRVAAAITTAQQNAKHDKYAEALRELQNARTEALKVVPQPKVNSPLAAELLRLAQIEQIITNDEQSYSHMIEVLAQVDKAIESHRGGDPTALRQARELLEQLTNTQRKHPKSSEAHARLAALQGDEQNFEDGMLAYRQQDWKTAESYLTRVANGNSPRKEDAKQPATLATAAQRAALAAAAEQAARPDWKAAVGYYRTALALFQQVGTDPFTASIYEACQGAVKRVRQIEENETNVHTILEEVQERLPQLQDRSARRAELVDKLQPIEFASLVSQLQEAVKIPSVLVEEANDWLRKVQEAWRGAYLASIQEAVKKYKAAEAKEKFTFWDWLKLAKERADELYGVNLLYQPSDKALYRSLQCEYLDGEYAHLKNQLKPNWEQIEKNRLDRLDVLGVERTPELDAQLQEAAVNRIEAQVRFKKSRGNIQDAKNYVLAQLEAQTFSLGPRVIELLVETCLEARDWQGARAGAAKFADILYLDNSRERTALWQGLTRAAELLAGGEIYRGRSAIAQLRKEYGDSNKAHMDLIDSKEKEFLRAALAMLIGQAEAAEKLATDDGYVDAAEKYALAHSIDDDNATVQAGLLQVSKKLTPGIEKRLAAAVNLKASQGLPEVYRRADLLHTTLSAIHDVAGPLQLDGELAVKIEDVLSQLDTNKKLWADIRAKLEAYDTTWGKALRCPEPLREDGGGGWDFAPAFQILDESLRASQQDREVRQIIEAKRAELSAFDDMARQLMQAVRPLMEAVDKEEFDTIIQRAEELEKLRGSPRAKLLDEGLKSLLRYTYSYLGKEAVLPREHRDNARKLKDNYADLADWADKCVTAYTELEKIYKELSQPLVIVKRKLSQRQIIQQCGQGIEACDRFLSQAGDAPPCTPLSTKARDEIERVPRSQVESLNSDTGWRARLAKLRGEAKQTLDEFERPGGPLPRLRQFMTNNRLLQPTYRGTVSESVINTARSLLQQCEEIDPQHEEVKKLKERLSCIGQSK